MSEAIARLTRWYDDHGLTAPDLAEWEVKAGTARIIVPVRTLGGLYVFTVVRLLNVEGRKYEIVPPHARPHTVLYGFNKTVKEIKDADHAWFVEGFSDVIAVHKAGIKNVVGMLTSKPSPHQLALIGLFARDVTFWLDGDEAGHSRALEIVDLRDEWESRYNINANVILVDNEDPSSYFAKGNKRNVIDLANEANTSYTAIADGKIREVWE